MPSPRPTAVREKSEPVSKPEGTMSSVPPARTTPVAKPGVISASCEAELKSLGVRYAKDSPAIDPASGCRIDQPVELQSLAGNVKLEPAALLDCPTAVQFAGFVRDTMQGKALKIFGKRIVGIQQASAFVCRPRNGTSKLSEHAFGRAVDIASITIAPNLVVPVIALPKDRELEATFLTTVRAAACGPFMTVLGPGSDADHAMHFHFDLAPRKGSAYCR